QPRPEPAQSRWPIDFVATTPEVALFPRHLWTRAMERALRDAPDATLDYADHRGSLALRQAVSGYLARVRGVRIDPARILIVQGFTQALDLLCRVLRKRGARTVAMESPSLPPAWSTIRGAGLRLVGRGVDEDGLVVKALSSLHADAIVVTPAHQFPTGAVMAPDRRVALVEWAARNDAFVIEDDYDAEFRFDRQPVGALQGLDPARVIHLGTASKTLAPGIRLGWMSVPAALVEDLRREKGEADSGSPSIDQLALARLVADGDYERHVAKMRQLYRSRRDALQRALALSLPGAPGARRRGRDAHPRLAAGRHRRRRDQRSGRWERHSRGPALADVPHEPGAVGPVAWIRPLARGGHRSGCPVPRQSPRGSPCFMRPGRP